MSAPPASDRLPLPRWRSYRATLASGELVPQRAGPTPTWYRDRDGRRQAERAYVRERDRPSTIDLVSSASLVGPTELGRVAAEALLQADTSNLVRQAAQRVLEWEEEPSLPQAPIPAEQPDARAGIGHLRRLLSRRPVNALRWTELSRLHTIEGNRDPAGHAMRIALALAPNDRYVLRCAARLRVHQGDAEGAHELLARTRRTRSDPWLLAAELSVAEVAGVPSRNLRIAQKLLDSGRYAPSETTELASALGSVELRAGSVRAARKLFRQALTAPTDNTVAQAQWASERIHGLHVDALALRAPTSWEARAYDARTAGDLRRAVDEARMWQRDQPFASRPAEFGSYNASCEAHYETAVEFARQGVRANPKEFLVRNNLAFGLLSMDQVLEGRKHLAHIRDSELDGDQRVVYLATLGLANYRDGEFDAARADYERAISLARIPRARALAAIMMAREEARAGLPKAAEVLSLARRFQAAAPADPDLDLWLAQVPRQTVLRSHR